jgi:drug/metabolite transporter (DMT)-like permease
MFSVRLSDWVDRLARIFGMVLVVIGVLGFSYTYSEGRPSDFVIGVYVVLAIAGVATILAVKKKTMLRRILAGLLNGFMAFCGVWMLFASPNDPRYPVRIILGIFLIVACGLSVAASTLSHPRPDIVYRVNRDSDASKITSQDNPEGQPRP